MDDAVAKSQATIPAGRYGDPAEFGAAAAFLCSAPASYVTGTARALSTAASSALC